MFVRFYINNAVIIIIITNALMSEPAASATTLHPRSYLHWDFTNGTTTNRYYNDEEKVAFSEETENAL